MFLEGKDYFTHFRILMIPCNRVDFNEYLMEQNPHLNNNSVHCNDSQAS
jgi:hypothetical protein